MIDGKLGICIVGCGDLGTRHALCWHNLPSAKVVSVCDIRPDRGERLASRLGLERWYTDYRQAIDLPEVEAVSVCIPTCLHPTVSIFALEHHKHVICEKPIALTLEDADAMIDAAARSQRKLTLGFMRRHSPMMAALRQFLAEGSLGRPVFYHAADIRNIRPKIEMHGAALNGGPVIDMAVHLFDVWATIFSASPSEVFAQGLCLAAGRPELETIGELAVDTASITTRFSSGDIGSFVVSWGLPPGVTPPGKPDQIYGPKGLIEVEWGAARQEARWMKEGGEWQVICSNTTDFYQDEIADFAAAILEDRPVKVSAEDGRAALQVSLAALRSIQTGKPEKPDERV
ncbi:MAG TPA: Gfo/Idh/MocA family oxidoreductase [Anaerolineaceae bacterium]